MDDRAKYVLVSIVFICIALFIVVEVNHREIFENKRESLFHE